MITINKSVISKLVSGGEACELSLDGVVCGYVKAGEVWHTDASIKVELVDAVNPFESRIGEFKSLNTPHVVVDGKPCVPCTIKEQSLEGLIYKAPNSESVKDYFVIDRSVLTKEQDEFLINNLPMDEYVKGVVEEGFFDRYWNNQSGTDYWFPFDKDDTDIELSFNDVFVKEVNHIDEGFEGLVYKAPTGRGCDTYSVIDRKGLTKEQDEFLLQKLVLRDRDIVEVHFYSGSEVRGYWNKCRDDKHWFIYDKSEDDLLITFNDIFIKEN